MAAAVHPHVCTVELPYHVPDEKATDDILVISYHNQGDRSAINALLLPCRGLGKQPAANVLGVPTEDPTDQSADSTTPILCDDLGDDSASDVWMDEVLAVPSGSLSHQSAGDTLLTPCHNPDDQSAVEPPVAGLNDPNHQAADDDHSIRSLTPGGQIAEPIYVTPHHYSGDRSAEITSYHDPGHQAVDDTPPISNHHSEERTSDDKPAEDGSKGSYQNRVDQSSDQALVISCHNLENSPVNEVLQIRDSVSGKTPTNDGRRVPLCDPGPEALDEALVLSHHCAEVGSGEHIPKTSGDNSGDKLNDDASLVFDHELEHGPENDSLLATINDIIKKCTEKTLVDSLHDSEHKIEDALLVSDRLENAPAAQVFAVSNHDLRGKGTDQSISITHNKSENHYLSDAVFPCASGHKHTEVAVLTPNPGTGKQRGDVVPSALSHHPELQAPDDIVLASVHHDSGDPSVDESLVISSPDPEDQPATDAVLIISNALNNQPTNNAHSALSDESNDNLAEDLLVVSPYAFAPHLLRLDSVSKPNQLLAKALTQMRAVREDFATAAYIESFNWSTVVDYLKNLSEKAAYEWQPEVFYIVVFRSRVRPVTNRVDLGLMDAKAHEEAMQSGGLLKYWFGVPDAYCRNLATCKFSLETL